MAAEFTMNHPPAGGGGGHPFPGGGKKKGFNKMYLYFGGALVIMLYIVFIKRTQAAGQAAVQTVDPSTVNYPTNSVDYQGAIQNQSDIIGQQLQQFQSQYDSQLQAISDKMDSFQGKLDNLDSHPNPTTTTNPTPAPTKPSVSPAPAKPAAAPAPKPAAPAGHYYTIKKGDTLSQIALDSYHRNPYNGDINKLAQANHIANPNRIIAGQKIFIPN